MHPFILAAIGGLLIGVSSWMLLGGLGRVAGITGIACDAMTEPAGERGWRWAFLAGLVLGGTLFARWLDIPAMPMRSPLLLVAAGLLVGFGTIVGGGCTSGHGVCGLGRRSLRSLVAVLCFMATGMLTVTVLKGLA